MCLEGTVLKLVLPVFVWLATAANATPTVQGLPNNAPAMMFLPPGASSCSEFLKLEPMQKYDTEGASLVNGDAENYFAYRGVEEWTRGFFTAANMLHVQNRSGDVTNGVDLYKLMPRLFDYCRSHPVDLFSNAALQLLKALNGSK